MLAGKDDIILDDTVPTFAKYPIDLPQLARDIGTMLLDQILPGTDKVREVCLMMSPNRHFQQTAKRRAHKAWGRRLPFAIGSMND